jgi:hypothetical protein
MMSKDCRTGFFYRWQNDEIMKYVREPERTRYMRAVWRMWSSPPHPTGRGAYVLLAKH